MYCSDETNRVWATYPLATNQNHLGFHRGRLALPSHSNRAVRQHVYRCAYDYFLIGRNQSIEKRQSIISYRRFDFSRLTCVRCFSRRLTCVRCFCWHAPMWKQFSCFERFRGFSRLTCVRWFLVITQDGMTAPRSLCTAPIVYHHGATTMGFRFEGLRA